MKLTLKSLLAVAALAFAGIGSALTASPAQAATNIVCDEQGQSGTVFPLDGIDGPAGPKVSHAFRCKNTVTGVKPSDSRTADLFNSLSTLPANVKNTLKSNNFKYFFFNNRAEAIDYFANTAPYNDPLLWNIVAPFADATTRCGNTGYAIQRFTGEKVIAVSVYNNCTYDQFTSPPVASVLNPSVRRTGFHETGHAFDFSLGDPSQPANVPSARSGFTTLFTNDKTLLTPSDWSTRTTPSKHSYICNLFSISAPTALEKDLGATPNGGTSGQVCQTSTVPYSYYAAKMPTEIALEKGPYFMTSNQEIWAEIFVIVVEGNNTSPPGFLPMVDRFLGLNQSPRRSFNCIRATLESYVNLLTAPNKLPASDPYSLQTKGCPVPPVGSL